MDILEAMKKEMFRRRLSHQTMKTYLFYVRKFLLSCRKEPRKISKKDCKEFIMLYSENEVSGNNLNDILNSLRFMMEEILRKQMRLNIRYSKTPHSAPLCLTRSEVLKLIDSIDNPKHRFMVAVMYGAGLRVSETVKLRPRDIDVESFIGWVRKGKGNKDRPFIIPRCLVEDLRLILKENPLYVFMGAKNSHVSTRSAYEIVRRAGRVIGKKVHPHTLRHSFATHLFERGTDITSVQSLLGHSEARTTMEYIHQIKAKLISIRSPLDA